MTRDVTVTLPTVVRAQAGRRRLTVDIVPYGVIGDAQVGGRVGFAGPPANLDDTHDLVVDHDDDAVIGRSVQLASSDAGLTGIYRVFRHPYGDQVLAAADPDRGDRAEVSVHAMVDAADDNGLATDWRLLNVSLVDESAFGTRVREVAAAARKEPVTMSDTEVLAATRKREPDPDPAEQPAGDPAEAAAVADAFDKLEHSEGGDDDDETATDVKAARAIARPARRGRPGEPTLRDIIAALAAVNREGGSFAVKAALSNITYTGAVHAAPPAWVGQIWQGVPYERRIVPLAGASRELTGLTVTGWKWTTLPEVAAYAGDKTPVPSNAAATGPYSLAAARLAGAHDIDRAWRDFGNEAFWESYFGAMARSYAIKSDAAALTAWLAGATVQAASATLEAGLIDASMTVSLQGPPTFALVAPGLVAKLMGTGQASLPAMWTSLFADAPVDVPRIATHPGVPANTFLVGTQPAIAYWELPGSPIRVETVNIPEGGLDAALFGYYAAGVENAGGLVKGTVTP